MNKLSWVKYLFSIWIVAISVSMVARFLTNEIFLLVPLSLGIYWISVRSLAKIKGYQ
ncbi:hypothetical protein [Dyadobacter flavalbus]|uniref:hypothetical protein n=1 Tax=Dyadobacter flavalbus TaxID=2579942 RepID=UPI001375ACEF|nr:hypothetical protein [Dyadobacter flavalbus]